jgi:hypothetical protein
MRDGFVNESLRHRRTIVVDMGICQVLGPQGVR